MALVANLQSSSVHRYIKDDKVGFALGRGQILRSNQDKGEVQTWSLLDPKTKMATAKMPNSRHHDV